MRIFLLSLFLVIIPFFSFSQKKIHFGLQAGFSNSRLSPFNNSGYIFIIPNYNADLYWTIKEKSINSFTLGGIVTYSFNKTISLQTEINYIKEGYALTIHTSKFDNTPLPDVDNKFISHYLSLPIFAKINIGKATSPYFLVGFNPQLSMGNRVFVNGKWDRHFIPSAVVSGEGIIAGLGLDQKLSSKLTLFVTGRAILSKQYSYTDYLFTYTIMSGIKF